MKMKTMFLVMFLMIGTFAIAQDYPVPPSNDCTANGGACAKGQTCDNGTCVDSGKVPVPRFNVDVLRSRSSLFNSANVVVCTPDGVCTYCVPGAGCKVVDPSNGGGGGGGWFRLIGDAPPQDGCNGQGLCCWRSVNGEWICATGPMFRKLILI